MPFLRILRRKLPREIKRAISVLMSVRFEYIPVGSLPFSVYRLLADVYKRDRTPSRSLSAFGYCIWRFEVSLEHELHLRIISFSFFFFLNIWKMLRQGRDDGTVDKMGGERERERFSD